jgi:hypothetical protein
MHAGGLVDPSLDVRTLPLRVELVGVGPRWSHPRSELAAAASEHVDALVRRESEQLVGMFVEALASAVVETSARGRECIEMTGGDVAAGQPVAEARQLFADLGTLADRGALPGRLLPRTAEQRVRARRRALAL